MVSAADLIARCLAHAGHSTRDRRGGRIALGRHRRVRAERYTAAIEDLRLAMSDHVHQVGIGLPTVFGADVRERLFERSALGENSVNETGHAPEIYPPTVRDGLKRLRRRKLSYDPS
jgi:hypothetical protein